MKKIEILGTGCPRCQKLADNATRAAEQLGVEFTVEKVTKIDEIVAHGVLSTPALVIDGKIVVSGRVATPEEIVGLLD